VKYWQKLPANLGQISATGGKRVHHTQYTNTQYKFSWHPLSFVAESSASGSLSGKAPYHSLTLPHLFIFTYHCSHLGGTVARGVAVSPEPDQLRHAGQYCELMLLLRCLTLGQDAVAGIRIIHHRGIHLTSATGKKNKFSWKGLLRYGTYFIIFVLLTEMIYRSSLGRYIIIYHSVHISAVMQTHDMLTCWYGSGSADPCLWLMDPDPAIFVIDLQDANKKLIFLLISF
jgi:hypothetical protein